ncbi:hypothetical protein PVMG_04543 [Plasmodium vivax Mauritania I]|uniref:Uncharacterized protein n=1 Tax=Plasmodium vivax Mauritania I TaxID=1035515 RepID=A0A0J9VQS0_PLAVI|nr:hypothetical protein PVMG_04543 [Plasmodium vivax Mauritania I]
MAQILTDFDKLKTNYAFLQEHSTLYDKFDGDVESDPKDSTYDLLCSQHISSLNENVIKHKNFCKKLMRNLGHFSHNPELHSFTSESCNILNYWVYNSKKKHDIPEKIINKVFGEYSAIMLNIFNTYIGDVRDALMNRDASTHMPALKFVCDCVKIYKNEKFKYCSNNNPKDPKHQKNCEEFNAFKFAYTSYLFGQSDLVKKIPSLDNIDKEYSSICGQFEETTVNVKLPTLNVPVVSSSDGDSVDTEHETSSPKPINVETRNNPISSTVSTSLGAVAGASSVLALLYKVNK